MATIDDVYKVLTMQPPEDAYQYLWTFGPMGHMRQVYGHFWLDTQYNRVATINNNTADVKNLVTLDQVKINEMHLAVVTADMIGKVNQIYASVYTEQLADQLESIHTKLDAIQAQVDKIGSINDDWDTGSETIYAYLNYVFG